MQQTVQTWLEILIAKARTGGLDLAEAQREAERIELPEWGLDGPWVALGQVLRRKLALVQYPTEPGP